MKTIIIKNLICYTTEDFSEDECRLEIFIDGAKEPSLKKDMHNGDTWNINKSYSFNNSVKIKLYDEDWPDPDDKLGEHLISSSFTMEDATISFTEDDADYELIFSVLDPSGNAGSPIDNISLRDFFGRLEVGAMNPAQHNNRIKEKLIFQIGDEIISIRDTFKRHQSQDGAKGNTQSIRTWVNTHCNYWSNETYITDKPPLRSAGNIFFTGMNWETVKDEKSRFLAGFQDYSRVTNTDNPFSHETRDWNWDILPDPQFMYMLGSGMKHYNSGDELIPKMHNEWETGSFPVNWRPFWGEYITCWGRHIWDVGHAPVVTEIHPAHTIAKERTTAAPIGDGGAVVPVNQAVIGMGLSGGFPGNTEGRWNNEFGGVPGPVWGDTTDCWVTNLKNHPLEFKLYPPVERPAENSTLKYRIKFCQYLKVNNWSKGDDFLELCQFDDPADGGEDRAFRIWNPTGFTPQNAPNSINPTFTLRYDGLGRPAYFDVNIDLSSIAEIPVGYYAIVECGWNTKGNHNLKEYEVKFETIKAIETDEWWDDWHLYYGVNGEWAAWWTDDFIEEGDTYTKNTVFRFWTVDNLPIVIRDCGIEWDGTDWGNEVLDKIEIVAKGPNHINSIVNLAASDNHLEIVSQPSADSLRIKVKGKGGDTSHQWKIKITKKSEI